MPASRTREAPRARNSRSSPARSALSSRATSSSAARQQDQLDGDDQDGGTRDHQRTAEAVEDLGQPGGRGGRAAEHRPVAQPRRALPADARSAAVRPAVSDA
ncbi:hypothetical protein ACLGIH_22490 [Streptomyces sp. HMX87]|uniref:hypothetical protein n=1 Tax=Streptomyces sp. HMX87 TaxID=3390849 RepID=UPI003A89C687